MNALPIRRQALRRCTGITPALAPQITAQGVRVLCSVREFMGEGGLVAFASRKASKGGNWIASRGLRVIGTIAAILLIGGLE
jgi:hypothetical protein